MPVAAQNSSSLLSILRSSFNTPITPVGSTAANMANIPPTEAPTEVSVADKLNLFDQVLTETEHQAQARAQVQVETPTEVVAAAPTPVEPTPTPVAVAAQAIPLAVDQAVAEINQSYASRPAKEAYPVAQAEQPTVEAGAGMQMVEVEPNLEMEIPIEVEGFIQEVQEHQEQLPHEIVIADGSLQLNSPALPLKPVVVLPITPEVEEVGAKKSLGFSVRWLVEWSRKLMKMFNGAIIYREA